MLESLLMGSFLLLQKVVVVFSSTRLAFACLVLGNRWQWAFLLLQDVVFGFRCSRLVASRTHMGPSAKILQAAQTAGNEACAQLEEAQIKTARPLQLCDTETLQGKLVPAGECLACRAGPSMLLIGRPRPLLTLLRVSALPSDTSRAWSACLAFLHRCCSIWQPA